MDSAILDITTAMVADRTGITAPCSRNALTAMEDSLLERNIFLRRVYTRTHLTISIMADSTQVMRQKIFSP